MSRGPELTRLKEDAARSSNWKRWGPYLSERQWGTVREDYSQDGTCWEYLPHDHARSRAYRWGEDGLLGICDREGRLCFALALWNGRDPILKERLFGLTGHQGNHGEDVKEQYYFLDSTPTHSYLKALYKYPQAEYPYAALLQENERRGRLDPEFELLDTGVFDGNRYFDVFVEYAKASPDDILIQIHAVNRGPDAAPLDLLPSLWFRNTWSWGRSGEGYWPRPRLWADGSAIRAEHANLGAFRLDLETVSREQEPKLLFTENETNQQLLFGSENASPFVKDAFHEYLVAGRAEAVNPAREGTKAAALYRFVIPPVAAATIRLRLTAETERSPTPFAGFDSVFGARVAESDAFYAERVPVGASLEQARVIRQAYAGLLWSKQFYYYVVSDWLEGDPAFPSPPPERLQGRNSDWTHLFNRDVISMPDTWEYPWYASWDLAFHMILFARIDPDFAKQQLILFLREWYQHPNGQIPAYEFNFGDANPPVHAWACWRVYKMTGPRGRRDRLFLERVFQKLLINFTWWVNRKDLSGRHLFTGGFLGLDNIGIFDRSKPHPGGGVLEQADGTAWMAFYCTTMLSMALELASEDPAYEDVASKFFEHFVAIADAMNHLGGAGLWDEHEGFYYDQLHIDGRPPFPLRIRSMVGIIPLFACENLEQDVLDRLPSFTKRMLWFLENRGDLARHISYMESTGEGGHTHRLLAIPSRDRLERVLRYVLDEQEFLSPYGVRSLSRVHKNQPYELQVDGSRYQVHYVPGEADSGLFGGNSNWRGPVWFPPNYLLMEALERYHHFYGDSFTVECPVGSGRRMHLGEVAQELNRRLASLCLADSTGRRPCDGPDPRYAQDPHWKDLVLFYEYFHGDTGQGLGASHQTGWTALAARCIEDMIRGQVSSGHTTELPTSLDYLASRP